MHTVSHRATSERVQRTYFAFQATANMTCFGAVFFVYYGERVGLSVPTILWLQSYFTTVRAMLDVPLGAIADRHSRRGCLVGANVALVLGSLGLVIWPTVVMAVLAETAFAVSSALRSGADAAFLYDALAAAGAVHDYPRAESRGQAVAAITSGAAAITGSILAAIDLRLPYLATIGAALAGTVIAAMFSETPPAHVRTRSARHLMGDAARIALTTPAVRWAIALATVAVVSSHVYFFLQQPFLQGLGIPVAWFGAVLAGTKVVTALVANVAHRVDARFGQRRVAGIMVTVPVVGLGAMAMAASPLGALWLLSRGILDGLWQPLANLYVNRLVPSDVRATLLSLQSLVARLGLAAALALLGLGTARVGLGGALAIAATVTAAVGLLLVAGAPPRLPRAEPVIPKAG